MSHFVKYEDIDNIRTITIDRPDRKNAINAGMLEEMCDFIKNAETNNMIRSIIITAQGDKVFSAGYDISSDSVNSKEDLLKIHLPDYQEKKRTPHIICGTSLHIARVYPPEVPVFFN